MSIDLSWETLTGGPDGDALAEKIRNFVHEKFQTVTLPRFIKSVKVHDFEFGSVAPEIELKDICDPLSDFYEKTEDGYGDDGEEDDEEGWQPRDGGDESLRERRRAERAERTNGTETSHLPPYIETGLPGMRPTYSHLDSGSPFLGVNTPGIPLGKSNLNYFRSQLAAGLSGTHTPLAAVAGAHLPNTGWQDFISLPATSERGHRYSASGSSVSPPQTADEGAPALHERASVSTLATNTTRPQTREGLISEEMEVQEDPTPPPRQFRESRVEDVQTVFRVRYSGDVKLSLTAEILLDYPMPSFVSIPLMLNITGLSFDGVAVLAYIRKRAHFCFLSPEDAHAAIGRDTEEEGKAEQSAMKIGGLLHEIKVESEIGQREGGKQVLKNVGKVEKFVLEQVRRLFEDEFVYPSFWTFLV